MLRYISLIICLALLSSFFLSAAGGAQKVMSVQVKEGQLRASPSHFGKIVARISYGHQMTVLEETGDWKLLSAAGGDAQGWMHATALTNKRLVLRAGQGDVGTSVSQGEIALAGKGFGEEVEAEYRKTNSHLDYSWIDRMEGIKVSPEQMAHFIADGRLELRVMGGKP